jgi:hypothetical protein
MKYRVFTVLSLLLAFFLVGFWAEAASDRVVRLRHIEGDVSIYPNDAQRPNEASINSPIYDDDVIETQNGRAELSFRNGVLVRLGDYSAAKIESAYSPMVIELVQGSLFVDSHMVDSFREELKVRAGEAEVFLIDEGNMRVDLGEEGGIRVTTIQGEAEVRANGNRVLLNSNERTYIDPGSSPSNPENFSGGYDELDDWNSSRMDSLAYRDDNEEERYVDDSLYYDTYELEQYGDWRYYGAYGNVWVPRMSAGWRPYYDGRWSYGPGGWFWVSYEPWGWAPYHYGRWGWAIDFGWYWIPGYTFGPSWVSWYDYGDYIGWCPLNYYNNPIIVNNWNYYNPVQKQKTIDVGNAWTFVKKQDVGNDSVKKISVAPNEVKKIRFDDTKIVRTPKKELTSYVIPKTVKTPAYVNDKRVAPAKGPDVENPIGLKHRDNTIEHSDTKSALKPGDHIKNGDKTWPTPTPKPKQINPSTRPPSEPKSTTINKDPGSSKNSDDRNSKNNDDKSSKAVTKSPPPTSNKNYNNNRSTSSSKYGSSDKKTSKPNPQNYMDRDSQYERYRKETSRPYDTYRSPYISREESDSESKSLFRDPRSIDDDRREAEVSPRYYEGARKMYERFEERERSDTKSTPSQPRYEPKSSGNREYSKPSVQPRSSSSSSHKSSAPSRHSAPSSKPIKKKD